MNCQTTRSRLLASEDPARPAAEVQGHLAACPACRQWQARLAGMERSVCRLAVPRSAAARAALVQRILHGPDTATAAANAPIDLSPLGHRIGAPLSLTPLPGRRPAPRKPSRSWRPAAYAGLAAAAAMLVLVAGWQALTGRRPGPVVREILPQPPHDQLVEHLVKRDLSLAEAGTAVDRVRALADLAEDLREVTRALVHTARSEDLMDLARLYERVVRQGVAERAKAVTAAERATALGPVADKLRQAGGEFDALARDLPAIADPFQLMAAAAKEVGRQLPAAAALSAASPALPPHRPGDDDRLALLRRDHDLVHALVDAGLRLAVLEEPLQRATLCRTLVRKFADEVSSAAGRREGPRASEMSDHLRDLLARGVAGNLASARQGVAVGSSRDLTICREGEFVIEIIGPVQEHLQRASQGAEAPDMQHALLAIRGGWDEVRKAIGPANRAAG